MDALIDTTYDFTDPVLTPEQIDQMRQGYTSAQKWFLFVDNNYPDIDAEEQKQIKLRENKKRDILNCGFTFEWKWDSKKLKLLTKRSWCKHPDECPRCQERAKQKLLSELDNITNGSVVTIQPEGEKSFKAFLTKYQYRRIPRLDGTIDFVLDTPHEDGQPLTFELKQKLAQAATELPGKQRITGNLGKARSTSQDEVAEIFAEAENVLADAFNVDIKETQGKAIFTSKSKLTTSKQVETEVLRRLSMIEFDCNIQMLQWIIDQLQEITIQVCKDNYIEYSSLYIETVSVNPDEVEWEDFERRLKMAQK